MAAPSASAPVQVEKPSMRAGIAWGVAVDWVVALIIVLEIVAGVRFHP